MKRITIAFALVSLMTFSSVSAQETGSESTNGEFRKFRIGGYGEMLYQHMDYGLNRMDGSGKGSPSDKRSEISIPRFILALDYKFTPSITLSTEIEFEYGGTGAAMEFDAVKEGGEFEYEIEKGGEVVLEQFHLTKEFSKAFSIRAGHMIVPVGLTNAYHEPINFFGTTRPESETMILPSTWHETGIAVLGKIKSFSYEVMLVNGLDPNLFNNQNWIGGGRQARFEVSKFTNPAITGRVNFFGIPHTRIGLSAYYGRTGKNASRVNAMKGIKGAVTVVTADGLFKTRNILARANVVWGNLGNSVEISKVNQSQFPKDMGFPRTAVAKNALSYGIEAGYNVGRLINENFRLFPFVRYEFYDPMHETKGNIVAEKRFKCDALTAGLNYYPLNNLVLKADYKHRRIDAGNFNHENTLSVGVAYVGWFFSK